MTMIKATFWKANGEVLDDFILSSTAFEVGGPQGEIRLARNVRDMMESCFAVEEGHVSEAGKVKVMLSNEPGEPLERFTFAGQGMDADAEEEALTALARETMDEVYTLTD